MNALYWIFIHATSDATSNVKVGALDYIFGLKLKGWLERSYGTCTFKIFSQYVLAIRLFKKFLVRAINITDKRGHQPLLLYTIYFFFTQRECYGCYITMKNVYRLTTDLCIFSKIIHFEINVRCVSSSCFIKIISEFSQY